jgi:hypothetical protein
MGGMAPACSRAPKTRAIASRSSEIDIGGTLEASSNSNTISIRWNSTLVPNGTYLMFAKAYSRAGEMGQSEETALVVKNY